jgi:hypothetical protein
MVNYGQKKYTQKIIPMLGIPFPNQHLIIESFLFLFIRLEQAWAKPALSAKFAPGL